MQTITKDHPSFKDFQFLLKARSKDTIKPTFQCIYVDKGHAFCTDSRRLHAVNLEESGLELADGLYDLVSADKNVIVLSVNDSGMQFPNVWQIIPDYKNQEVLFGIVPAKKNDIAFTHNIYKTYQNFKVNFNMLADLFVDVFEVHKPATDMSPIVFENHTKFALLMPLQTKQD